MWLLVPALALAGYGDAIGGHPSPDERELFVWANAVRVAPDEFIAQYQDGGCDWDQFTAAEQTPVHPLRWNPDLGEAARGHSDDMNATGVFGHDSSDGTTLGQRLAFWPGTVGENVASGFTEGMDATLSGWMCSPSHREILMWDLWDELGTGQSGVYYTQDFGDSYGPPRAVSMASHVRDGDHTVVLSDWWSGDGAGPNRIEVVVDGVAYPLGLLWGAPGQGIYATQVDIDDACHRYHVEAEQYGVITRFPEQGAYGWGDCAWDDPAAAWSASQVARAGLAPPIEGVPIDPGLGLDDAMADEIEQTLGTAPYEGCVAHPPPLFAALLAAISFAGARPRSRGRPGRPDRTQPPRR